MDLDQVEKDARTEWANNSALQREFPDIEAYLALKRAEARGSFKVIGGVTATQHGRRRLLPMQMKAIETRARNVWETDADIREEFQSLELYLAYVRAEAQGRFKVILK